MARPKKQTVDYFPHFVNSRKTMFILESNFGNDGYAFWFKLLELLGMTEGHAYNCNNTSDWEFLLAKTRVTEVTANNILQKLADLDAIDGELWKDRIVWSDNFVQNLLPLYSNRKTNLPKKPITTSGNQIDEEFLLVETPLTEITTDGNTQSKVKESKVKESKVKESKEEKIEKSSCSSFENKDIYSIYEECGFGLLNKMLMEMIDADIELYSKEWLIEAMKESVKQGKYKYSYVEGILRNWRTNGKEEHYGGTGQNNAESKGKYTGFKPQQPKITEEFDTTDLI